MMKDLQNNMSASSRYRFHPPVKHLSFTLTERISFEDFLNRVQNSLTESIQLKRALWHGGFFLNTHRLNENKLPPFLNANDQLEIYYFLREPEEIHIKKSDILWQKEGMFAVNKAAWLPTQASRCSIRFSLEHQLQQFTQNPHVHAIHRLDRQTSGIVLFAADKKSEAQLMKLFHDKKIKKQYLAYVSGSVQKTEWEVKGYLQRDFRKLPLNIYKFYHQEQKKSRFSHSIFKLIHSSEHEALVQANPITGRTHQIRVHLSHCGHPILGDDLYGGKTEDAERILLHAQHLEFTLKNTKTSEVIRIEAPLPPEFNRTK